MQMKADALAGAFEAALIIGAVTIGVRLWWQQKMERRRHVGKHHRIPFANYQRRWDIFYLRDGLRQYIDILVP